jgi:hypothetical protein
MHGASITRTGTAQRGGSLDELSVDTGVDITNNGAIVFTRPASISTHATSSHPQPRAVSFPAPKAQRAFSKNPAAGHNPRPAWTRPIRGSAPPHVPIRSESASFEAALVDRARDLVPGDTVAVSGSGPCFVKARLQCSCIGSRRQLSGILTHRLGDTGRKHRQAVSHHSSTLCLREGPAIEDLSHFVALHRMLPVEVEKKQEGS